jgi:hypothetical protein
MTILVRTCGVAFAIAMFFGAAILARPVALAQEGDSVEEIVVESAGLLSTDDIRALVAPVALYPDELLAVILPGATNPLQIVQAGRYLEKHKADSSLQPDPDWDPAVLALINYPDVIQAMNDDLDWTEQLGNAVLDQQTDVLDMIQQIRAEATASGYLQSDEQQAVTQQGDTVIIESAQPEVIYVPTYDPQVVVEQNYDTYPEPVYSTPYPSYYAPGATFFAGAMTGAVFAYGFDWDNDDIDIDCCNGDFERGDINVDRNFENNGNINIGSDNVRERNVDASRFSAEAKAGQGKMKWDSNKARQKSTTNKQTRAKKPQGVAPAAKPRPAGGQAGTLKKPQANKPAVKRPGSEPGKVNINRGLGDYESGRSTAKQSQRGQKSLSVGVGQTSRSSQSNKAAGSLGKSKPSGSRSKSAGAFGGSGGSKYVPAQKSRGSKSMQRSSRPSRSSRR